MIPVCWRVIWYDRWGYRKTSDFEKYQDAAGWYKCLCEDHTVRGAIEPLPKTVFDILQELSQ
jgi:hypothetical protein